MAVQYSARSHPFDVSPDVILSNELLREPQREAYSALFDHWRRSTRPAIVQIPVGCGKTGLMAALPFGNSHRRALLVAPNVTIRAALAKAVDVSGSNCFLRKMQITDGDDQGPFCAVLDGRDVPLADCESSHFVVANIQQIVASGDRWLQQFPPDYFDLLLIDEGHHNPAASWRKLFARFTEAKAVSLTATPFRSDGQELIGDIVYRYTFSRATDRGYIKQLRSLSVAPTQVYFTARDDTRLYTLEDVLKLRESTWFRRGIALAPKCNWDIVRASAQQWNQLRQARGTPHQIIAATCSIEHAEQVRALYAKLGLRVAHIHSQLPAYERRRIIEQLREEQLDCIVQVEMLGEGFDHPPLSIAAVFRPFASLAPYVQFLGRIMRVLREGDKDDPDNQGWVVSHAGLHVDRHWRDFNQLDVADQEFFAKLVNPRYREQALRRAAGETPRKRSRRKSPATQLPLPTKAEVDADVDVVMKPSKPPAQVDKSPVVRTAAKRMRIHPTAQDANTELTLDAPPSDPEFSLTADEPADEMDSAEQLAAC